MRSVLETAMVLSLVAACGSDRVADEPPQPPDVCETSFLDYTGFGEPFILDWCAGCHTSTLPAEMRQDSPIDVNFDDRTATVPWVERIRIRATGASPTMPPAGGPSDEERALLAEWIDCGAR
ncbi:MAG: hypothetical protein ABI867_26775 [Kofleriaceae bacterium]